MSTTRRLPLSPSATSNHADSHANGGDAEPPHETVTTPTVPRRFVPRKVQLQWTADVWDVIHAGLKPTAPVADDGVTQPREQQACQGSASLGFEPCGTRAVELLRLLLGSHRLKLRRCLLHRRPRSKREGLHEEQDSETSESERPRPGRAWQGAREQRESAPSWRGARMPAAVKVFGSSSLL